MLSIDNFTFLVADSEKLKEAVFRLRYQVFSCESSILKKEDYADTNDYLNGIERDEFDGCSIHIAALNEEEKVVGALRLVLNSRDGFPIQRWTKNLSFVGLKPEPEKIAEISRLAVSRHYRRRQEDGLYGVESYLVKSEGGMLPDHGAVPKEMERRKRPVIVLGLYRLTYHLSKKLGISHWYLITETKLFTCLSKYGFIFHQIGDPVEYHGMRTPYLGIIDEMERKLHDERPEVLNLMLTGLEEKYHPQFIDQIACEPSPKEYALINPEYRSRRWR